MSKFRILLWDIDGTILNFDAAERAAIRKGFSTMKLGECSDEMLFDYSSINNKYWKMLERGELTKPEILVGRFREFFSKYHIDPKHADAFNSQYQIDLGDTICFNDNAMDLVTELKSRFKQYAVTNGTAQAQHRKLSRSGLDELLDGIFISDELGVEKPNIEFFNLAFSRIQNDIGDFSPEEVLIIGDSLTSDMRGGNNAGIKTCWYNPARQENTLDVRIDYEIASLTKLHDILAY